MSLSLFLTINTDEDLIIRAGHILGNRNLDLSLTEAIAVIREHHQKGGWL